MPLGKKDDKFTKGATGCTSEDWGYEPISTGTPRKELSPITRTASRTFGHAGAFSANLRRQPRWSIFGSRLYPGMCEKAGVSYFAPS